MNFLLRCRFSLMKTGAKIKKILNPPLNPPRPPDFQASALMYWERLSGMAMKNPARGMGCGQALVGIFRFWAAFRVS